MRQPLETNEKGISAIPLIKRACPNVFMCFTRTKNGNVIVFEALPDKIDAYWLDLEPSYRKAARERGRLHDRDEFGHLDHYAYGFTARKLTETSWEMKMRQLPKHPILVRRAPNGAVRAFVRHENKEVQIEFVHVTPTRLSYALEVHVIDGNVRKTIQVS